MNDLRADIRDALLANPTISRICGRQGVHPVKAPLNAARPHILYWIASAKPSTTHDQVQGSHRRYADAFSWTVAAVAEDITVCGDLIEAVYDALHGRKLAPGSYVMLFQDLEDQADFKQDNSADIVFAMAATYATIRRPV